MNALGGSARKCASVPSLGHLFVSLQLSEAPHDSSNGKGSQACFSPVFDLELDAKLGSSTNLDRCFSQQQLGSELQGKTSLLQQMLTLCRCSSPVQAQLLQQLQRLRSAACAGSPNSSSTAGGLLSGGSGHSDDAAACVLADDTPCSSPFGVVLDEAGLDVEAMACELLAGGYLVQVRDGAQQQERNKTPRSCLQNLRHRYIVCLGVRGAGDGEPAYLPEPLVVEPRFREQFTIAHPTPAYEALLQSVPPCFVGPVANLEAVVKLMAEQIYSNFKLQGLPVPPWRTRTALLSKWSPAQLSDLAAKIASLRRLAAAVPPVIRAMVPCQSHDRLFNDDRPAAAHADHAAVGSAPTSAALLAESHASEGPADEAGVATAMGLCTHLHIPQVCPAPGVHLHQAGAEHTLSASSRPPQPVVHAPPHQQGQRYAGAVGPFQEGGAVGGLQGVSECGQPLPADSSVLAALAARSGSQPEPTAGAALKFTRKASAEWKHQRSNTRKIKGLLATALKKSVGSSRSNLLAAAGAAAAAEYVASQAAGAVGSVSGGTDAQQGECSPCAAAGSGDDAFIRRTHFRAAGDEPWRRITTVRLGAYAQQQQRPSTRQHAAVQP